MVSPTRRGPTRVRRTPLPTRALGMAVSLLVCVGLGLLGLRLGASPGHDGAAAVRTAAPAKGPERRAGSAGIVDARWAGVLEALLSRRAAAWREGKPALLRAVYVAGSPPLAEDTTMLRSYLHRGLRVSGVRSTCGVVLVQRQLPDRASLIVVDTLGPAVAHDPRGRLLPLPLDLPTRHRVLLRMTSGGWRIAGITVA